MLNFIASIVCAWVIMGIVILLNVDGFENNVLHWAIALLIILSMPILEILPGTFSFNSDFVRNFFLIFRAFSYLIGPFIYFYGHSIVYNSKIRIISVLFHCIPFFIWLVIFSVQLGNGTLIYAPLQPEPNATIILFGIGNAISLVSYGIYLLRLIQKNNREIDENFSSRQTGKTLSWLRNIVTIYLILFSTTIMFILIRPVFGEEYYSIPMEIFNLLPNTVFVFIFILCSFNQKNIGLLKKRDMVPQNINSKYERSGLSQNDADLLILQLRSFMGKSKAFLNPELTIDELSNVMDVNKHHLSQAINSTTGSNFFHFVNGYRVLEFQQALKEERYPNYSLTGAALECGFNSSSSFYSIFKRNTGMTPKQYNSSIKEK